MSIVCKNKECPSYSELTDFKCKVLIVPCSDELKRQILELTEKVEKMKCCDNCYWNIIHCTDKDRCRTNKNLSWLKDNWQMKGE